MKWEKQLYCLHHIWEEDVGGDEMGKAIILPASHMGGRRYMIQNYHDNIAICRVFRPPDFFFTFTYNPKWHEIMQSFTILLNKKSLNHFMPYH
jgi:hypothetical protein